MDKLSILRETFGHDGFRSGQEQLVDALLCGRDVLGVMPTGAGKSLCYQVPALMLPGITLVVSPLISLMKDQVAALKEAGVPAAYINSSLSQSQYFEALRRAGDGLYKLIYIAPERLMSQSFLRLCRTVDISLIAVDEAHCVSQWGQDFRPSYLMISDFISALPARPPVGAFTATATGQVKEDIERMLMLRDPVKVTTGFDRPNLFFQVESPANKNGFLLNFIARRPQESGIVYCSTRKYVESVCGSLISQGIPATRYHAGLTDQERRENQDAFVNDQSRVMVATNAFGMGIDKSNVSYVVHYNMPKNIESYYQEAGRAGRDGSPAHCVLLFSPGDIKTASFLINSSSDNENLSQEDREQLRRLELQRLDKMAGFCRTTGCLRAYLLEYFGEAAPESCGSCGNCRSELKRVDITEEAQKILSGVARVEGKYRKGLGSGIIIKMLTGSCDRRIRELGLDSLSTYGILKGTSGRQLQERIQFLIQEGYLRQVGNEYPVLRLTPQARDVLFNGKRITFAYHERPAGQTGQNSSTDSAPAPGPQEGDQELYEALRTLRGQLASQQHIPPYMVFNNATLMEMCERQPQNMDEFLYISGVGQQKAGKYGQSFLDCIAGWRLAHQPGE